MDLATSNFKTVFNIFNHDESNEKSPLKKLYLHNWKNGGGAGILIQ